MTIHLCPPIDGGGLMPYCGLTPFEALRGDQITEDPALVTCPPTDLIPDEPAA